MHIALSAHFWGQPTTGSGQYLHRLVEQFTRAHPSLRVTLIADQGAARHPAPSGVRWVVAPTPFDGRSSGLAKLWFEQVAAPRAALAAGADLFHVPYFAPPARSSLPVVTTIHDLIPMILPAYRGSVLVRGYTQLAARAASRSDWILADSEASRRDIVRLLDVQPERVETIYLAADESFRPQAPTAVRSIRQKLDLPQSFALYLGGFDIRKNVPLLLEALARSEGSWPLVIAGKMPATESAFFPDPRRVATELGVEKRVCFAGWIEEEDKPALLSAATLFAFPSAYEGFGLPILEAMACGTPTITTSSSSLPELAGDGAVIIEPGDGVALQREMDRLMANAVTRGELAARGVAQAARFSWQRCASETIAAYARVLQ